MQQSIPTSDLPDDTRHIIAQLGAPVRAPRKRVITMSGGGDARLGDALLQVMQQNVEAIEEQDAHETALIEKQVERWQRFRDRWKHVAIRSPAVQELVSDMRAWEARKAGFHSPVRRTW